MTLTNRSRARAATLAPGLALVAVLTSQLVGPSARAQMAPQDRTLDVQLFQPAIGPRNFVTVEGTSVAEHKRLSFGLFLNYQTHPYVVFTRGATQESVNVVDNQTTLDPNKRIQDVKDMQKAFYADVPAYFLEQRETWTFTAPNMQDFEYVNDGLPLMDRLWIKSRG